MILLPGIARGQSAAQDISLGDQEQVRFNPAAALVHYEAAIAVDSSAPEVIVVKGGRGGRGNMHFATPEERAPRRAEKGEAGEEKELRTSLRRMER